MPTFLVGAFISSHQRWFPLRAMRHAAGNGFKSRIQAVPEDREIRFLEAAVRLLVIERVDAIAVTRAPEQLGILGAHYLPDSATETFALRIFQYRELVEVRQTIFVSQDHRRAVIFAYVHAVRPGALEIIGDEVARRETRIDQRTHARKIHSVP